MVNKAYKDAIRERRRLQKKKEYNKHYKAMVRYRGGAAADERKTYRKRKILPTDIAAIVEDKKKHNALVDAIYDRRRKQAVHKPLTVREARAAAAAVPEEIRKKVLEMIDTCGPEEIFEATGVSPHVLWHFAELREKGGKHGYRECVW